MKGADGLLYRLGDGREFKSPSVAGSAVMGAKACNGWKFWRIAEAAPQKRAKKPVKKNKLEPASEHSAERTSDSGDDQEQQFTPLTRQTPSRVCLLVRRPAQLTKVPNSRFRDECLN